ncbi:tail assembly chaperone [Rhodococcus phage Apiary]|nr:tail assembly chaperone [Rhodococcus phage Braxoaddie]WNM67426.1 tail assembly chaperone [Rhodococcus phage Polyyuki]WNM69850.1 tail assembly chaperone [Rhodococcus phage Apiary]
MAVNFATLASRAEKRAGKKKDFVLQLGDDQPDIVIPRPDAIVSMQSEKAGSLYDQLQVLTGKEFPRILELVKGKPIQVVQDLISEMWDAWEDDAHEVPGGKRGLVELFDKFGPKILWDFRAELGIDILDYFTGERSWWEFYDFLYELPRWGKFHSALLMDRDYAEHIAEKRRQLREQEEDEGDSEDDEDSEKRWQPKGRSPEGFTPELNALFDLDERIQSLARILIMVNSKSKPPDIQKRKRPVTALDLLDLEDERDEMKDLASKFGLRKKSD